VAVAKAADVIIVFLGIDGTVERESHDRTSIDLPEAQHGMCTLSL
jgi:hypothetical protein